MTQKLENHLEGQYTGCIEDALTSIAEFWLYMIRIISQYLGLI
jgi:hypothetical protein